MDYHSRKFISTKSIKSAGQHISNVKNLPVNYLLGLAVSVILFLEILAFILNVPLNAGTKFNYYSIRDIAIGIIFIVIGIKVSRIFNNGFSLKPIMRIALYISIVGLILHSSLIVNVAVCLFIALILLSFLRGNYLILAVFGALSLRLYYLAKIPHLMGLFLVLTGVLIYNLVLVLDNRSQYSLGSGFIKIGFVFLGIGMLINNYAFITVAISLLCLCFKPVLLFVRTNI